MRPRLALYMQSLPRRWWNYTASEKRHIANAYDLFIIKEPPEICMEIKQLNPKAKLIFPWMPQLVPASTMYSEWNPMRHVEGWALPQLLRDHRGRTVASDRSYGNAWIDCSKRENVLWLIEHMTKAVNGSLKHFDGFTLEVASFTQPWRGFFPEDLELQGSSWFDFSDRWAESCHDFLELLRNSIGHVPWIITGSDILAGEIDDLVDGRLVEDFGMRGSWISDAVGENFRSIADSKTRSRTGGYMTIVKERSLSLGGYSAACLWDTIYTLLPTSGRLDHLGYEHQLPRWSLSNGSTEVKQETEGDRSAFSRKYESGTLRVEIDHHGDASGASFLFHHPSTKPPTSEGKGCTPSFVASILGKLMS